MKRRLLLAVMIVVAVCATATDRFYIDDLTIAAGETRNVSILLDNEDVYTAFQSDLFLPEGLSASNFAMTSRKHSNHTFSATERPDGGYRLLCYSLSIRSFSDNSGALVTFDITANDDFSGPATIALCGTLFTTITGVEVSFADEVCIVTLPTTVLKGDVDGDGVVNITDVTVLIDYLLSGHADGINISNADVEEDGSINITDVTVLIDLLLNGDA